MNRVSDVGKFSIRRLANRCLIALLMLVALVAVDQAAVHPLFMRLSHYAPLINVAGRQRMLSQKLVKAALASQLLDDSPFHSRGNQELRSTLMLWSQSHAALSKKGMGPNVAQHSTPGIARGWADLDPHFCAIRDAATWLLKTPNSHSHHHVEHCLAVILEHEPIYLMLMDHVVGLLEREAGREIVRLRALSALIASAVVVLIGGFAWFCIRPAARMVAAQLHRLQSRAASHSRRLAHANRSLDREARKRALAESKMEQLSAQLAHAARVSSMGQLAAGLAHELNQPLGAIVNYAETCELLLSRGSADFDQLYRPIQQITQAALRAGALVRRMRNFARPQRHARIAADVNVLVREVVKLCNAEVERANVTCSLALCRPVPRACVDAVQIQQVIVNLVQNAVQAMSEANPATRRLEIRTSLVNDSVQVAVSDSGPGFHEADAEKLFTPFHTTKPDGLGIGLAICREIVEQHQGTIWAQSPPGGGATVCFTLPRSSRNAISRRKHANRLCR